MFKPKELIIKISDVLTGASIKSCLVLNSPEAVHWLVSVAAHESHMGKYRKQINGPALGIFQMEPHVIVDVQRNVLSLQKYAKLRWHIQSIAGSIQENDEKAILFARAQMLRFPEPFPFEEDRQGQAELWKKRWNTEAGRGTIGKFLRDNERLNPVKDLVAEHRASRNSKNTI